MPNTAPSLPDLDVMMNLVAHFEAASAQDTGLHGAELDELLRHVPGKRAILSGTWQGQRVVFRMYLDPENTALAREWAEMTRVWPHMQSGPARIAQPLHYAADHGILVVEHIAGTPLMQHMWQSKPETRAAYLRPAAQWLHAYTVGSQTTVRARSGVWLERAEKGAENQPHPRLQQREHKILNHLQRLAPLCDQPWRNAIIHGDFHPNNLIANADRLTGIDMGGSASIPIYKDMARFLMHMGRRGLIPSGQMQFGVDAQGIAAFAEAFDLSDHERELILPFMLGCEALLRVESAGIKRGRVRRAADMSDQLIADLAQI